MGNPDYRLQGIRDARLVKAGPTVANTFTDAGDLVTATAHGLTNGMIVVFQTVVTTTGVTAFVERFVIGATTNTFQIALTLGGAAVALTTDGTGTYKALLEYIIYLVKEVTPDADVNSFKYVGSDQSVSVDRVVGYRVKVPADCIPMSTDMAIFGKTAYTVGLPDSYTSIVYGGDSTELNGVTVGLWYEGAATRRDATTLAETDVYVRRTFPVGRIYKTNLSKQTSGDKADGEEYTFGASKTTVDVAGGALPATVPTGGVFYHTMEKVA